MKLQNFKLTADSNEYAADTDILSFTPYEDSMCLSYSYLKSEYSDHLLLESLEGIKNLLLKSLPFIVLTLSSSIAKAERLREKDILSGSTQTIYLDNLKPETSTNNFLPKIHKSTGPGKKLGETIVTKYLTIFITDYLSKTIKNQNYLLTENYFKNNKLASNLLGITLSSKEIFLKDKFAKCLEIKPILNSYRLRWNYNRQVGPDVYSLLLGLILITGGVVLTKVIEKYSMHEKLSNYSEKIYQKAKEKIRKIRTKLRMFSLTDKQKLYCLYMTLLLSIIIATLVARKKIQKFLVEYALVEQRIKVQNELTKKTQELFEARKKLNDRKIKQASRRFKIRKKPYIELKFDIPELVDEDHPKFPEGIPEEPEESIEIDLDSPEYNK